jgi:hypothetical protein
MSDADTASLPVLGSVHRSRFLISTYSFHAGTVERPHSSEDLEITSPSEVAESTAMGSEVPATVDWPWTAPTHISITQRALMSLPSLCRYSLARQHTAQRLSPPTAPTVNDGLLALDCSQSRSTTARPDAMRTVLPFVATRSRFAAGPPELLRDRGGGMESRRPHPTAQCLEVICGRVVRWRWRTQGRGRTGAW